MLRAVALGASALVLLVGCRAPSPGNPAATDWPAHEGVRCVGVPAPRCEQMADAEHVPEAGELGPELGATVICTRPEGCTSLVGAGETMVHHTDGGRSGWSWGYGGPGAPPPAPPPGWGQPRPEYELECVRLARSICETQVDEVFWAMEPGAAPPVEIRVSCNPNVTCTERAAEGTTEVRFADGRTERGAWSMVGAAEPPGTP